MKRFALGAVAVVAAASLTNAEAATIYTDRAAYQAAIAGATETTDAFDNAIATADSITFDSGVTAAKSSSGVPPTLNRVSNGDYDGFVVRDGFRTITWTFPTDVFAFGGDFSDLSSLFVTGDFDGTGDQAFSISDLVGSSSGFFGIVGLSNLSSVLFTTLAGTVLFPGGAPFGGETFTVDNLSFASADGVVPLPAALPLFLAGLAGLGFSGRRRKTA